MNSPSKTRERARYLPRFSLSLLLCVILFYGLGIVTQWYLEGRRNPEHQELRIRALQSVIAAQDRYIREFYSRKEGGMNIRKTHLELLVEKKQLEAFESKIGVKKDEMTPIGMNYSE